MNRVRGGLGTKPLRKNYGLSNSIIWILVVAGIVLVIVNIVVVTNTIFGASFYSYWLSGRLLLAQGQNPYGAEVFTRSQDQFPSDTNLSGFTLPLYSLFIILPFTFINNFKAALALWMILLEAALVLTGIKIFQTFPFDTNFFTPTKISVSLLVGYYTIMALLDGDMGIVSVLCFTFSINAIKEDECELAGILLAFSTMKYGLMLFPIIWIIIWCAANQKGTVISWFFMVLFLLVIAAALLETDWMIEFFRSIIYYYKYMKPSYFAKMIENWQPELGGRIGWGFSSVLIFITVIEFIVNAKKDFRAFLWVLSLTIVITFLSGIPSIGKNIFFLWIPGVYSLNSIVLRWKRVGKKIILVFILQFLITPWFFHLTVYQPWSNPVEFLNILLPLLIILILYWNRWWIIDTVNC